MNKDKVSEDPLAVSSTGLFSRIGEVVDTIMEVREIGRASIS